MVKISDRYLALDVLRGMTIAFMILVNTPGSWQHVYPPLLHAKWHGCTPTDLVFPFFLFVVGVSMYFSFSKYDHGLNQQSLLRIGRRVLLIFVIGLFLNSFPQWMTNYSELRIMGVLQRIALAYGFAAIIALAANRKWIMIHSVWILLVYWGILWFFGGDDPYSLTGNAATAFDSTILGESHLYKGFMENGVRVAFDPEGLLSTIPAVVSVLIGYLAGMLIKQQSNKMQAIKQLVIYGAIFTAAGYIWGFAFPINKPLWTSSYVLYTAGMAAILFALLIFIIDVKGYKKWSDFFMVFGVNPLFIFALSGLWARTLSMLIRWENAEGQIVTGSGWLYNNIFVPLAGNLNGSLLYAITHVVFFWLIGYILYRYRIFIKV
jgi:predicted acyltransferase